MKTKRIPMLPYHKRRIERATIRVALLILMRDTLDGKIAGLAKLTPGPARDLCIASCRDLRRMLVREEKANRKLTKIPRGFR